MTSKRASKTFGLDDDTPDNTLVFIKSPVSDATGTCTAFQFRNLWGAKGWTIASQSDYDAHQEKMRQEDADAQVQVVVDGLEAQQIINGEVVV